MDIPPSVKDLFAEAVEKPFEERAAFLDHACEDQVAVRARVEELLAIHDGAGDFLAAPTHISPHVETAGATGRDGPGTVIDRYRLLPRRALLLRMRVLALVLPFGAPLTRGGAIRTTWEIENAVRQLLRNSSLGTPSRAPRDSNGDVTPAAPGLLAQRQLDSTRRKDRCGGVGSPQGEGESGRFRSEGLFCHEKPNLATTCWLWFMTC